jgi:hypothetical protein
MKDHLTIIPKDVHEVLDRLACVCMLDSREDTIEEDS